MLYKMTSHYGDGVLDVYDWIPLLAVVFGGIVILTSLVPNSVFGRKARKDEDVIGIISFRMGIA